MTLISLRMRREAEDDWGKKRSRTWSDKSEAYPMSNFIPECTRHRN
jgi:hypothetical protein